MNRVRQAAIVFFLLQGIGVLIWWIALAVEPRWRQPFLAPGSPDCTLLAFRPGDLVFFVGGSLIAAYGLAQRQSWAMSMLCIQAGAAGYAGLYALSLPVLSGGGWIGAILMAPSLILPLMFAWLLCRGAAGTDGA